MQFVEKKTSRFSIAYLESVDNGGDERLDVIPSVVERDASRIIDHEHQIDLAIYVREKSEQR